MMLYYAMLHYIISWHITLYHIIVWFIIVYLMLQLRLGRRGPLGRRRLQIPRGDGQLDLTRHHEVDGGVVPNNSLITITRYC